MTITVGAIERAVIYEDRLSTGRRERTLDDLDEIEQQIQVEVSGTAGDTLAWDELDITFDVEFIDATDQRYSNLTVPQFSFGAVCDVAVLFSAVVLGWATDDRGVIVGATVAVGAVDPGGPGTEFIGTMHLTFQGFGSLAIEPADPDFGS